MTRYDAVNYISHGIAKRPGASETRSPRGADDEQGGQNGAEPQEEGGKKKQQQDALTAYCVNLNNKAKAGKIDPLIGRESEINRTIQVLCRRSKNNPLYVGDPGVGKTAIAEGLAKRIVEGDVPEVLHNATIFALDMERRAASEAGRGYVTGSSDDPTPLPVRMWQEAVHRPGIYDLEVDTSVLSPEQCAQAIRQRLRDGAQPGAIERLAQAAS